MERFESEAYRVGLAGINWQYSTKVTGIVSVMLDEHLAYTYDHSCLESRRIITCWLSIAFIIYMKNTDAQRAITSAGSILISH